MKSVIPKIIILIFLFGCNPNNSEYTIKGISTGVEDGKKVYLKTLDTEVGVERLVDSAIISNELFKFNGRVDFPEIMFLSINDIPGIVPIAVENSDIEINIEKDNLLKSKISGSETHKDFANFVDGMMVIQKKSFDLIKEYRKHLLSKNTTIKDSLSNLLVKYEAEAKEYPLNFIHNNSDKIFSLIAIDQETNKRPVDLEAYKNAFDNLSKDIKNTNKGLIVKKKIDSLFTVYEKIEPK